MQDAQRNIEVYLLAIISPSPFQHWWFGVTASGQLITTFKPINADFLEKLLGTNRRCTHVNLKNVN